MKIVETIIAVNDIPSQGAWAIKTRDGNFFMEGRDGWFEEVKNNIYQVISFGVLLPIGRDYSFERSGYAVPGGQPVITSASWTFMIGDTCHKYIFTLPKQVQNIFEKPIKMQEAIH